jgi:2-oxoglutarate ferredoxin oxidoreductase subunit beta
MDFVIPRDAISAQYDPGSEHRVTLHDGSVIKLRKVDEDYDATDRDKAYSYIRARQRAGEVATGLLYVSTDAKEMMEQLGTVPGALTKLPYEDLCPRNAELQKLQERFR